MSAVDAAALRRVAEAIEARNVVERDKLLELVKWRKMLEPIIRLVREEAARG
jgi:hypothetical protein